MILRHGKFSISHVQIHNNTEISENKISKRYLNTYILTDWKVWNLQYFSVRSVMLAICNICFHSLFPLEDQWSSGPPRETAPDALHPLGLTLLDQTDWSLLCRGEGGGQLPWSPIFSSNLEEGAINPTRISWFWKDLQSHLVNYIELEAVLGAVRRVRECQARHHWKLRAKSQVGIDNILDWQSG